VCFELGRFPFELPRDLPDEQIELMVAYLTIRQERQKDPSTAHVDNARAVEKQLQAAESAAWASTRKAVTG